MLKWHEIGNAMQQQSMSVFPHSFNGISMYLGTDRTLFLFTIRLIDDVCKFCFPITMGHPGHNHKSYKCRCLTQPVKLKLSQLGDTP